MSVKTVFIKSGEIYYGENELVQTTLGSCVAVCAFDRRRRVGGMIHYLLPNHEPGQAAGGANALSFGDQAIRRLLREFKSQGTQPRDLEVAVLGGLLSAPRGPGANAMADEVARENVRVADRELRRLGLRAGRKLVNLIASSLQVRLNSGTGEIDVHLVSARASEAVTSLRRPARVLIVDDSRTVREPLKKIRARASLFDPSCALVALGASTGGTEALRTIFARMSASCPPIVVVQHMPASFTKAFAESLSGCSEVRVKEAESGDVLEPGRAYLAPGGKQMRVGENSHGRFAVEIVDASPVNRFKPSVDFLFLSLAELKRAPFMKAAILTGMGDDGARGLLKLRSRGAWTIAQDEATSVVFGMPKAAIELNAAAEVVPLDGVCAALARSRPQPLRQKIL